MIKDGYSIEEVSVMTGLTTRTIRNYLSDGQISAEKKDGKWFFKRSDFEKMIENPYVKAAIKAKNNAPVFDFLKDTKKKNDSVCIIVDRVVTGEGISDYIENLCNIVEVNKGAEFKLERTGDNLRIILSGPEEIVKKIYLAL